MKNFWIGFVTFILSAGLVFGATLLIMSSVHKHSVEDEFNSWFPAIEKEVETEEESDDDIIIDEETELGDETQI